jgi:hypothetical protein
MNRAGRCRELASARDESVDVSKRPLDNKRPAWMIEFSVSMSNDESQKRRQCVKDEKQSVICFRPAHFSYYLSLNKERITRNATAREREEMNSESNRPVVGRFLTIMNK